MLETAPSVAKVGFDTAEKGPSKIWVIFNKAPTPPEINIYAFPSAPRFRWCRWCRGCRGCRGCICWTWARILEALLASRDRNFSLELLLEVWDNATFNSNLELRFLKKAQQAKCATARCGLGRLGRYVAHFEIFYSISPQQLQLKDIFWVTKAVSSNKILLQNRPKFIWTNI